MWNWSAVTRWQSDENDVIGTKVLDPDPGLVKSLGAHHSLESAIADLVDNSVDAGARTVLVRFVVDGSRPTGLLIVDNGRGMDDSRIDDAMRLGRQRDYAPGSQGFYGLGLKAASFSHADTLTVWSKTSSSDSSCGRRLRKLDVQRDYSCAIIDPDVIAESLVQLLALVDSTVGTIVSWRDTTFPRPSSMVEADSWLENAKTSVRMHLGLLYHRLLSDGRLRLDIDVFDTSLQRPGPPERVVAIDPFEFSVAGVAGYPITVHAVVDSTTIPLRCHIVPPKSSGPQYRLYGRDGADSQGFFIYRSDRLLQAGGWNDVVAKTPARALARVAVDDFDSLSPYIRMNPEKRGVIFGHEFVAAVVRASDQHGTSPPIGFEDYLARAESVLVESRRRRRDRRPVVEPARGFHEEIRRIVKSEIPIKIDEDPVDIRWRRMPEGKLFELDRETRTIHLNQRYREMLTGGRTGLSDAPLLKTLMFLLTEQHFTGQRSGPRDKDLVDMWDAVLGGAVQLEAEYRSRGRGTR